MKSFRCFNCCVINNFPQFFFFRADIDPYCVTMWECFKFTVSYGFQNGGGVADSFVHTGGPRLILDLAFFVVVLVILLNVFLGMIIDTFSSLRADKIERMRDTQEVCFICGIDKQVFDRASDEPDGFKKHIKIDHNMWNYLYFIFMLWEQDRDDDDGLEQFVRRAIDANEITWFPMNKAMRLDRVATRTEVLQKELKDSVRVVSGNILNKIDDCKGDVHAMMMQFMSTLRQEALIEDVKLSDIALSLPADEDSTDGATSRSQQSGLASGSFGQHISIGIDLVNGLKLSPEELKLVSCRLISDTGMFACRNKGFDETQGAVFFDSSNSFSIFDNVQPSDRRSVQLQIISGDATKIGASLFFVGHVEINAKDLLSESERYIYECKFDRQASTTIVASMDYSTEAPPIPEQCTIRLLILCTPAEKFGRSQSPRSDDESETSRSE
jgi:hypothetical protein